MGLQHLLRSAGMGEETLFKSVLSSCLEQLGLSIDVEQVHTMWRHFVLLTEANRRINLTSLTDPARAAALHYADSLAVIPWLDGEGIQPVSAVDIGTGGGFPAIPLAICKPQWQITAIDGTGKKIRSVASFVHELGLANCAAIHCRSEEWLARFSEAGTSAKFDLILFRAIAPLADCLKIAAPFCRIGSTVICYKGRVATVKERSAGRRRAKAAGFRRLQHWPYKFRTGTPVNQGDETIAHQLCCYVKMANRDKG